MVEREVVCLLGHGDCPKNCTAYKANKFLLETLGVPNGVSQGQIRQILDSLSKESRKMLLVGCIREATVKSQDQAKATE